MSGRPRTFQEPEVIERATQLFLSQGYESTGLTQLLDHIGMARQSLYNVFGDKHGLFIKCLQHYRQGELNMLRERLSSVGSPYEILCDCLVAYSLDPASGQPAGSLLINSACEFGASDSEVLSIIQEYWDQCAHEVSAVLHRSVEMGELPPTLDVRRVAWGLTHTIGTMRVLQRAGLPATSVQDIAYRAIEGIAVNAGI